MGQIPNAQPERRLIPGSTLSIPGGAPELTGEILLRLG